MSVKLKFTAAGDALIQRPIQEGFVGFEELTPSLRRATRAFSTLKRP